MKKTTYLYGKIYEDGRVCIVRDTPAGLRSRDYRPARSSLARLTQYAERKCTRREDGELSFAEYAI